jgi:putative RNA 2'-phosphotransferase
MDLVKISKRMSYVLRHRPDTAGIVLTPDGWAEIDALIAALGITREQLDRVVAENDKQRFAVDGARIRASQGHSVEVELGYSPAAPPATLFHGTAQRSLGPIFQSGLVRGRRHHVHLSADTDTALRVGSRHGVPAVLAVDAGGMTAAGFAFFRSDNGVWLTEAVPPAYLRQVT